MQDSLKLRYNKEMYDFDKIIDRSQSNSQKWEKYAGRDILPMWVADSDFETAPEILDALKKRVAHGIFGYAEQPDSGVYDAIQYHLKRHYDWCIERNWIVPLPSLVSGLSLSCMMTEPSSEVLMPQTIYPPFKYVTDNNKRQIVTIPMRLIPATQRWILDLEELEASLTPQSRLLFFCNPHNPAGTVYKHDELKKINDICQRHDLLVCSDEIHCDLILDKSKKHIPFATLSNDAANRSITLMAASKTFNIAGLGFGFAIIPNEELRTKFRKLAREIMPDVNVLAQTATEVAFKHAEGWRLEQIEYLRANRDYLLQEINAIDGLKMYPLEATFLAWIDVSALNVDDPETFFENAGVGISAGKYFGNNNFIRLNFACPRSTVEEAVKRIRNAVKALY